MAAIDFPASPTVGQIFVAPNLVTYQWSGTLWLPIGGTQALYVNDTPPAVPGPNQLWWNSTLGAMFVWYNDGNSTQWVPASASAMQPFTRPVWQMVDEVVLVAPAVEIRVAVPAGCKQFQLIYEIQSTVLGVADIGALQCMQGATVYSAANHNSQVVYGVGATAAAALSTAGTFWSLGGGVAWQGQVNGSLTPNVRSDMYMNCMDAVLQTAARVIQPMELDGGPPRTTVTGFRFASATPTNFAIGSTVRAMVLM